jgi:hypothetical protein
MKHPLIELTKIVSSSIPNQAWASDPVASKQGVKSLVQAIKSKAARAGIHKINNILNVKIPITISSIEQAAKAALKLSYEMPDETVKRMLEDFLGEIRQSKTLEIPDRVVKNSTGNYHNAKEPEHAFRDSSGTYSLSSEPIVTLLDYARALHLIANRYHAQIAA